MSMEYTVGELVAEFLTACQVRTAFGIVSIHNIPILDAVGRRNQIRFVMTRGETGAGHMADGHARVSRNLTALISSTGPGAANAVPGLVEARFASTPLIHITGATATKFGELDGGQVHHTRGQSEMLRSVSKSAYKIRTANEALGILTRAAVDALTAPAGPVSVEIPIDIQRTKIARPALLDDFHLPLTAPTVCSKAELDELARRVARARRPMLWVGSGAKDARGPIEELLSLGFAMVTSWAGHGVVPDDNPMNLGALNGNGVESIEDLYRSVDLMLIVGSRVRGHETGDFSVVLPEHRIQIDVDPLANGRTYSSELFVCGDAKTTLEALVQVVRGKMSIDPEFPSEFRALKERVRTEFRDSLGSYAKFAGILRKTMPRDAVWVRDITVSQTTWGNRLFELYGPRENVYPIGAGIGQGVCLGIGAAIAAQGRKTVIMTGDGGLFFNIGELWTAVQEGVDALIIVMNDRGYGVIKHIQDATAGGRHYFADLRGPDLSQLAALAGIRFWKAGSETEFETALADAMAIRGTCMLEVDMKSVGDVPKYFPYAPKIPNSQKGNLTAG